MRDAIDKIRSYCSLLTSETELFKKPEKLDACIRNFQVLGDAASRVPAAVRKELPGIPWREISAMRNILVHEYFGVSPSIIWKTITNDLPLLELVLNQEIAKFSEPVHPWKICPAGETYVRHSTIHEHLREGKPVKSHLRRDHCRESHTSTRNVITAFEAKDMVERFPEPPQHLSKDLDFGKRGIEFDKLINGWTEYWNQVLKPNPPLDPRVVKALIASESSFIANSGKGKTNTARGLMQLMPQTLRALNGARDELKDHTFEFETSEVFEPSLNIAAGIRWLFRKRELATRRLKREATWEEAVSEYKDYLRRIIKNPNHPQKGMKSFRESLKNLGLGKNE
jgi:uncharacterized protein with HEPN domain